jgi:hypothetical protein
MVSLSSYIVGGTINGSCCFPKRAQFELKGRKDKRVEKIIKRRESGLVMKNV